MRRALAGWTALLLAAIILGGITIYVAPSLVTPEPQGEAYESLRSWLAATPRP